MQKVIIFYLILGFCFFPFQRFEIDMDSTAYIGIAYNYAQGNFLDAVNGTFSPLLPLLLTPFVLLNFDPLVSTKLLLLLSGLFLILITGKFLDYFQLETRFKYLALFILAIQTVFYAFFITTPDLILAVLLMVYLTLLFNKSYLTDIKYPILAGILAALAYFSKAYAFTFCLLHLIVIHSLLYFFPQNKENLKQVIKYGLVSLLVFLALSLPWIAILSYKYHYLNFGTVASYNLAIFGRFSQGHPFDNNRLISPPNSLALSSWEDPSLEKVNDWNPLGSFQDLKYQFFIFRKNFLNLLIQLESISIFSLLVIFLTLFQLFKTQSRSYLDFLKLSTLLSIGLYSFGYTLISIEIRYLWPVFVLILTLATYQLGIFLSKKNLRLTPNKEQIIVGIFTLSFIFYPVWYLSTHSFESKEYYDRAVVMKKVLGIEKANLATNTFGRKTLYLSYYTNSRFFGAVGNYQDTDQLITELTNYQVDYFILWEAREFIDMSRRLSRYLPEISDNRIPGLKIYAVKTPGSNQKK